MAVSEVNVKNTLANGDSSDKREYVDRDGFWKDLIERFLYPLLKNCSFYTDG